MALFLQSFGEGGHSNKTDCWVCGRCPPNDGNLIAKRGSSGKGGNASKLYGAGDRNGLDWVLERFGSAIARRKIEM